MCFYAALFAVSGATVLRGVLFRAGRLPWRLLGGGLHAWTAGFLVWRVRDANADSQPIPSLSDALEVSFYPLACAALARTRLQIRSASSSPASPTPSATCCSPACASGCRPSAGRAWAAPGRSSSPGASSSSAPTRSLANRRALMLDLAPSRPGDAPDACSPEDAVEVDPADQTSRVALLADHVARHMGLSEVDVRRTRCAAELHDVGKLAIPAEIPGKRQRLDPQEWAFVRRHTIIGEHIAECASALAPIAPIIRSSHERWDGGGYPDGLAGDASGAQRGAA